jgi:hypothetical protein
LFSTYILYVLPVAIFYLALEKYPRGSKSE